MIANAVEISHDSRYNLDITCQMQFRYHMMTNTVEISHDTVEISHVTFEIYMTNIAKVGVKPLHQSIIMYCR